MKLNSSIFWLAALLLESSTMSLPALEPANPNSNLKVKAILNYLDSLAGKSEKRLLSGQFTDFGRGAGLRLMSEIHDKTGHWPAILGADYADFARGGLNWQAPNKAAIDYWNQGGLITISAHLYNPARTNGGGLRDKGVDLKSLLDSASETHARWMKELDQLAAGLQELQAAGVVVLWRPFHEMNGGWFWWGAQDPATFIQVWQHMFDYFTKTKQLNNLLWVYGPNHGQNTAKYYAGDHYVDIIGLDAYTDFIDKAHIKGYDEIIALRKPFGFTEYGPHGAQNPPGDYDYRRFIEGIMKEFPQSVFFMSWNARWSLARNYYTKELLDHPWMANREDLPENVRAAAIGATPPVNPPSNRDGGWKKHPANPVLGGQLGTCFDVSLLREGDQYRMWFSWRPKKSVAFVESADGVHWNEPVIVLGPKSDTGWEDDINRPVVVKRGDRYQMWYTGQAKGHSQLGYATSTDGKTWTRQSDKPVLTPGAAWEKVAIMCPHVLWDETTQKYRMWYSGGEQYEPDAIGYATSPDGLHWTKSPNNPIFRADPKLTWEQHKVTACQVVRHQDWYYMFYIGFRDVDHAQIGVARSRDGITGWERHPANPIIKPDPNQWDHDACYKPFAIFDGQKWLLWYNGRHGNVEQIGLAIHEGEGLGF